MHAKETLFLPFIGGLKQFVIPIYQRKYSWEVEHCERLFNDIIIAGNSDEPNTSHFFGSIVYVSGDEFASITGMQRWLVIDGQQRLTTLMLLLHALAKAAENIDQETKLVSVNKIYNQYYLFLKSCS